MSRRTQCDALQWLAAGLAVFLLVSAQAQDRDLDNDGLWDDDLGGIDRDVDNDGTWDYDKGGIDRDLDNDGTWDHGAEGIDRDVDNDGSWDHDAGGIDRDLDNDGRGTSRPTVLIGIWITMECGMSESVTPALCAKLTADGEGLELLAPCYVARKENVSACTGGECLSECFPGAVEGAGLVALSWYEGIEQVMESVNLHPFEDAAGYMPTGHRLSIPGVHIRLEEGSVVARRENISLTRH